MASLSLPTTTTTTTTTTDEDSGKKKKKWISFGLGKIFSSVFSMDADADADSDADSASDTEFHGDGGEDHIDKASPPIPNSNQEEQLQILAAQPQPQPPHTNPKAIIHHLITQHTFTREESHNLIKLIQSRIVQPSHLHTNHDLEVSPQVRNMAIAESKKWLEDKKKTAPSTSQTIHFGPSKLNTNNSHFFLKRDYISSSLWDPKEESSRRLRPRLSENAYENISSFTRPGSSSRLFDRDVLDSHKNLNFSPVDGKGPSNAGLDIISSQAGTAEATVKNSEPTLENNVLQSQEVADKEQTITEGTAVNLNKGTEGIVEVVNLETSDPTLPAYSEKNGAVEEDQKILTNEQTPLEGNKGGLEPENFADQKPHEGELHITNSLHGSTNKNSANCPAVPSNMESEFESSINGGPTSSTAGPDVSDDKSLNDSNTQTGLKTLEADKSPVRKGRKRVVSGRSRGRGKVRGRGT